MHQYARQRAILCKAVIEILQVYSLNYFGNDRIGENVENILIGFALYIAQHEGRPLSATDISEYLGMSRTTVARKLKQYERAGLLEVQNDGRRVEYTIKVASNPTAVARLGKLFDRLKATLAELTKMDDSGLET